MNPAELKKEAREIRKKILKMITKSKSSHIGSCFSIVDIVTVLYNETLSISSHDDPDRDIFILSKGHAAAALYATLAQRNFFSSEILDSYSEDGSLLAGHVIKGCVPGLEATVGSLGHGFPMVGGFALANKGNTRKFYCLVGDGECNEGSIWEAANFCSQFKLNNLTVIIDCNKQQGMGYTTDIMNMDNMKERWSACGWETIEVDGHNFDELKKVFAYSCSRTSNQPLAIIAHTIKGKGISWMEDRIEWHYRPPTDEELKKALLEIEEIV